MKDYLPIGSVVKLEQGQVNLLIIGYCKFIEEDKLKTNDYVACICPVGLVNMKTLIAFKHEEIKEVIKEGEKTPEFEKVRELLNRENK